MQGTNCRLSFTLRSSDPYHFPLTHVHPLCPSSVTYLSMVLLLQQMWDVQLHVIHYMIQLFVHIFRLLATEVLHPQILVCSLIRQRGRLHILWAALPLAWFVIVDFEGTWGKPFLLLCFCQITIESEIELHFPNLQGVSKAFASKDPGTYVLQWNPVLHEVHSLSRGL